MVEKGSSLDEIGLGGQFIATVLLLLPHFSARPQKHFYINSPIFFSFPPGIRKLTDTKLHFQRGEHCRNTFNVSS